MDYDKVQSEMRKIDNSFDPHTIDQVHKFLQEYIGPHPQEKSRYHIAAATAIVSECTKVPTVGNGVAQVFPGMKVENVMKRLNDLSTDVFLDTINYQMQKYTTTDHHLKEKIPKIRLAYRSFKKYQKVFEELYRHTNLPKNITTTLQSFFWIIFLLIKIKNKEIEDLQESTKILIIILQQIFTTFFANFTIQFVNQVIKKQEHFGAISIDISEEETFQIRSSIIKQIQTVYLKRSYEAKNCFQKLSNDEILLARLVDDLNQQYDRTYSELPEGRYIDEITFLGLSKNLTPQPVFKKIQNSGMISQKISFDDDEDEKLPTQKKNSSKFSQMDEEIKPINLLGKFNAKPKENLQTIKPQSNFQVQMTPFSFGMFKNSWVKECLKKVGIVQMSKLQKIIQESSISAEFIKENIFKCIQQILPHCLKKQNYQNEIYKLFNYLVVQLSQEIEKKTLQINVSSRINEIVCLATCLYNYAMRSLNIQFKNYCKIFNIDLIRGFQIIFYVGSRLNIPNAIRQYLYELEKVILIKELWDNNLGYELLEQGKFRNKSLLSQRLFRHIESRIKEICSQFKVEESLLPKINRLVEDILNEKYELLLGNKLDQIIVCSITSCLRINESKYATAINHIFHHYNQTPNSFHSIKGELNFRDGKMNLFQFYNYVFQAELQDMIKHNSQGSFICTPIREQQLKKVRQNSSTIPPISTLTPSFGKPMTLGGNSYQKGLNKLINNINRNQQRSNEGDMVAQEKEEGESPRFGGMPVLKRQYTFGQK